MAGPNGAFPRFQRRQAQTGSSGTFPLDFGGRDVVARLLMRLKAGPEAAGEGRHALDRLDGSIGDDRLSESRLLVTELLTNSVRHACSAGEWIMLDVRVDTTSMRIVVSDSGPGFDPQPQPRPHDERPGGWGLCLVDHLADRWGVETDGTTSVWAELDHGGDNFVAAA